jgi:hypothetical protein
MGCSPHGSFRKSSYSSLSTVKRDALPLILLVLMLAGCSTNNFPLIDKPDQLVKDCDALVAGGATDPANWPASIRSLNPVAVDRGENYVMITIFAQANIGARGYIVCRKNNLQIAHYTISPSQYPDVYQFELLP